MSFYAVDSTVKFSWAIRPTDTPPVKADFDIILIRPNGNASFSNDGITTYIAPTATTSGIATYNLNLNVTGLFQVSLAVGTPNVHIVQAHRDIYAVVPPPHVIFRIGKPNQGPEYTPPETPLPGILNTYAFDLPTSYANTPVMQPGGVYLYLSGAIDTIWKHSLSAAYNINTASYTGETITISALGGDFCLMFRPDGTRCWIADLGKTVADYTMSIPWDIETLVYTGNFLQMGSEFGAFQSNQTVVNSTGTRVYSMKAHPSGCTIFQYNFTSPWDITTGSYSSSSFFTTEVKNYGYGLALAPDDKTWYLGDREAADRHIHRFEMGTIGDISTSIHRGVEIDYGTEAPTGIRGLFIADDYSMLISDFGSPYDIHRYSTNLMLAQ